MNKRDFNVVGNEGTDNQELAKGIAFVKSRRAELNVVQMVENMRDQAMPNGVIINDAYCDRSMTRDYDREGLNAFFATLKEEDFEVVVVRSLNEITDDIFDLEEFVKTITDMGIWLYSLEVGPVPIIVSHTVLTGHRGLPTKTLFTNMDKLEVGDIFYIKVLDETLAYQIDQILTVLPQETDSLSIEPGKDYATLVTCTPFAINTHRLLVRGERIPYEEATKQEPDTNIKPELSFTAKVLIVTIIVIFIGLMIAVIYSIRDRKRRKVR